MSKKTIRREELVNATNLALKAPYLSNQQKLTIVSFVEAVLITGNAYNGYTVETDENIAKLAGRSLESFKELPIGIRKEWEVSTRRYF